MYIYCGYIVIDVCWYIQDEDTILSDMSYVIWIRAENDFDGGNRTDGTATTIKTLGIIYSLFKW